MNKPLSETDPELYDIMEHEKVRRASKPRKLPLLMYVVVRRAAVAYRYTELLYVKTIKVNFLKIFRRD